MLVHTRVSRARYLYGAWDSNPQYSASKADVLTIRLAPIERRLELRTTSAKPLVRIREQHLSEAQATSVQPSPLRVRSELGDCVISS